MNRSESRTKILGLCEQAVSQTECNWKCFRRKLEKTVGQIRTHFVGSTHMKNKSSVQVFGMDKD